jgi:phage/plasmid-like protein (TIGR03299 family)
MAHNLSTDAQGNAMMVSLRENPWHGLGTVIQEPMSGLEFLKAGRLDFQVVTSPMFTEIDGERIIMPDRKAVSRKDADGTRVTLGTVGNDYHVLQNAEMIQIFENLSKGGQITYETAGALFKGETVWILAKIPELKFSIKNDKRGFGVATDDSIPYMMITSGHIGNQALVVSPTVVRVVCNNTLRMAKRDIATRKKKSNGCFYSIRHTAKMPLAIKEMETYFQEMINDFVWNHEMHQALAQVEVTEGQVMEFFNFMVDPKIDESKDESPTVSKNKETRTANRIETLKTLWNAPTNQLEATRGTFYALMQTGIEYVDHEKATRVTEGNNESELKLYSANFGTGSTFKAAIVDKVREMAGV